LGWSYSTWKVFRIGKESVGTIDKPAKLLALQDVHANGWFPSLLNNTELHNACLNPPENDFVLGDQTLAPTMGPPPDCGNGWWNYSTLQCDYWIPPPFNATECPDTVVLYEECPTANITTSTNRSGGLIPPEDFYGETAWEATHPGRNPLWTGFLAGVLATLAVVAILYRWFFSKRFQGYQSIPNPYQNNGFQEYYHHSQNSLHQGVESAPKPLHASRGAAV
jgi:hypothetical protein